MIKTFYHQKKLSLFPLGMASVHPCRQHLPLLCDNADADTFFQIIKKGLPGIMKVLGRFLLIR